MSTLGFFSADCLGMTLYQLNGGLVASEVRKLAWGPWKLDMQVDAESDIINGKEVSFWVTLAKKVKLYVVVREKECWLIWLDSKLLKKCEKTGFAGETLKERIVEFKPAAVAFYQWKKEKWSEISLKDGSAQGVGL